MSDFKNVEVHDTVWDLLLGWGKVSEVHKTNGEITFIQVKFNTENMYFFPNGCAYGEKIRRLFWDEVSIPDPPRPKKKVLKTFFSWAYIYPHPTNTSRNSDGHVTFLFSSVEKAKKQDPGGSYQLISFQMEVEE